MSEERFRPLEPEQMTPDQKRVAHNIMSGPRGGMRGPFKALLRSPELADRVQKVGEYIRFHTTIPARLNEIAILVTARKWTAQFEWYAHRQLAMKAGVDPTIADAIAEGRKPERLNDDEAAVYDFAHALVHTGSVSDRAFAGVAERFGEQGVVDLIGAVGYYSLVSFVLNVDQVPIPEDAQPLKPL